MTAVPAPPLVGVADAVVEVLCRGGERLKVALVLLHAEQPVRASGGSNLGRNLGGGGTLAGSVLRKVQGVHANGLCLLVPIRHAVLDTHADEGVVLDDEPKVAATVTVVKDEATLPRVTLLKVLHVNIVPLDDSP